MERTAIQAPILSLFLDFVLHYFSDKLGYCWSSRQTWGFYANQVDKPE
jgi:hypothetical protein